MILADSHIHTEFSPDSSSTINQIIEQAVKMGLEYITITDHCDFDYPLPDPNFFLLDKYPYVASIAQLKESNEQKIHLGLGVELGLVPSHDPLVEDLLEDVEFDFIIGSTHVVDGLDPYYPGFFDKFPSEQAGYRKFLEGVIQNLYFFDSFDILGHLDYFVRLGPTKDRNYLPKDFFDLYDEIFYFLINNGRGIELNTSGWSRGVNQPHPHPDLIKRYRELGGEIITVGSDAHSPRHVAADFPRAAEILKDAGFKYYAVYKARKPFFLPL